MGQTILGIASLVAFVVWVYTLGVWRGDLVRANGSRPVISMMIMVGSIMTIMTATMLTVIVNPPDLSKINYLAAIVYRIGIIGIAFAMHRLHGKVRLMAETSHAKS